MEEERRTVVVSGVPPSVLPGDRMNDKLVIHFQSGRKSHGGDVESVRYPTNISGVAFVTFDDPTDAQRVVQKEEQILKDSEFPDDYRLTVFPFTRDVFLYVPRAVVDLSEFGGDHTLLIRRLHSTHRSLRFLPLHHQRKAIIEGPFAAVQALRADLIRRAKSLKSAQKAAAGLRESSPDPRVISHRQSAGSVSCSVSEGKPEPGNGLSTSLQTTGEATEIQSSLSNAKTQIAQQKVSNKRLTAGSFLDTYNDEVEMLGARSRLEALTVQAKSNWGQGLGEKISAGIRSSLSGLDPLPTEEISKHPSKDKISDISHKRTGADRISSEIREENHFGSGPRTPDYLKESDQSSSAVTATLLRTRLKDVSQSSKMREELTADCPDDAQETSIWVDYYTYRYLEEFNREDLNRCLVGLDVSIEGSDLVRISLTENGTSTAASRTQRKLESIKSLIDSQQLFLRVYEIRYDEQERPDKKKLMEHCADVHFLFDDVLYLFEDFCVKIIGPSVSSHLFYKRMIAKLKGR